MSTANVFQNEDGTVDYFSYLGRYSQGLLDCINRLYIALRCSKIKLIHPSTWVEFFGLSWVSLIKLAANIFPNSDVNEKVFFSLSLFFRFFAVLHIVPGDCTYVLRKHILFVVSVSRYLQNVFQLIVVLQRSTVVSKLSRLWAPARATVATCRWILSVRNSPVLAADIAHAYCNFLPQLEKPVYLSIIV